MKLESLVPLMVKEFLWVYDDTAEIDHSDDIEEHFLVLGPHESLVNEKINEFSDGVIKIIKDNIDDLCTKLTDYLNNLSIERGFSHGIRSDLYSIENYYDECMDYLMELEKPLMLRVVLPKFFESINCDELKPRMKSTYRTDDETKATAYLALKKFCASSNEEFNNYIDEKINELLE